MMLPQPKLKESEIRTIQFERGKNIRVNISKKKKERD